MAGLISNIILFTMHYALICGSKRVVKMIYKPYGPKMCTGLSQDVADVFTYTKEDLSCHHLLVNDSWIAQKLSTVDSNTTLEEGISMNMTVASTGNDCREYFKGKGNSDLLRGLSKGKTSADNMKVQYNMLLHKACKKGLLCIVQYILSQRLADIDCLGTLGKTPVMVAARNGQVAVFDFLVSQRCDLDTVDDHNNTVLHVACMGGNTDIIMDLLKFKSFVESRRSDWMTPMMVSAFYGCMKAFTLLVSKGSNMTLRDKFNNNILHIACQAGNADIVRYILSKNIVNIDSKGHIGMTALLFAAREGHVKIYSVLVNRGCDLKAVDKLKQNVLHAACCGGHVDMVKYILSQKLHDIESKAYKGMTPLMLAAEHGHLDVFDFLVTSGCFLFAVNSVENTVLHVACCGGHVHMVKYILSNIITDVDIKGHKGRTPLMIAVECGQQEVIELLMKKDCNITALDEQGYNVLHLGCFSGRTSVVKYILSLDILDIDSQGYNGRTAVMMAVIGDNLDVFGLLMSKDCRLSILDDKKNNILHVACLLGRVAMVKGILSRSTANLNSKGHIGKTPVLMAARHGHLKVLNILIHKGCNLRALDEQGNNILILSCLSGNIEVVKVILSQGVVDLDKRGYLGQTPVMAAAESGHVEIIELLISKGCNVRVVDKYGSNILHIVCYSGHINVIKYILSLGITDIDGRGYKGMTPVMVAVEKGHREMFDLLMSYHCHLSALNNKNNNVLHIACLGGHAHLVEYILSEAIADINSRGHVGRTPVMLAVGHEDVVKLLVRKGCNMLIFDDEGNNILHVASLHGHVNIVKYILSLITKVDIDSTSSRGRTAVMIAALAGQKTVVELLVSKGCNLRSTDKHKNNILHVACIGGHLDVVRYVLSLGIADIDSRGTGGKTPILMAAKKGHMEVVKLLYDWGCDFKVTDKRKNNILHLACFGGNVSVVRYILQQNIVPIDSRGQVGRTPVMAAAEAGHSGVVKLLLSKGCNPKARDEQGNTILHVACLGGHVDMVRYLLTLSFVNMEARNRYDMSVLQMAESSGRQAVVALLNANI